MGNVLSPGIPGATGEQGVQGEPGEAGEGGSDMTGTADPTSGSGIAADISTIYRNTATGYLWVKKGAPDWDWLCFSTPDIQNTPTSQVKIGTSGTPSSLVVWGAATFNAQISVEHILHLTGSEINLASGTTALLAIPTKRSLLYLNSNAGAAVLSGIDGASYGGEGILCIHNTGSNTITLTHSAGGVPSGSWFDLIGGTNKVLPAKGSAILVNTGSSWRILALVIT